MKDRHKMLLDILFYLNASCYLYVVLDWMSLLAERQDMFPLDSAPPMFYVAVSFAIYMFGRMRQYIALRPSMLTFRTKRDELLI